MYPLVTVANARHRRELTVRQRVRLACGGLAALAALAAAGVFGGNLAAQVWVVKSLAAQGIGPGVVGWAAYAIPVAAMGIAVAPLRMWIRIIAVLLAVSGAAGMAVMGRPRGMTMTDWETAIGPELPRSAQVTAWVLLIAFLTWATHSAHLYLTTRAPAQPRHPVGGHRHQASPHPHSTTEHLRAPARHRPGPARRWTPATHRVVANSEEAALRIRRNAARAAIIALIASAALNHTL